MSQSGTYASKMNKKKCFANYYFFIVVTFECVRKKAINKVEQKQFYFASILIFLMPS